MARELFPVSRRRERLAQASSVDATLPRPVVVRRGPPQLPQTDPAPAAVTAPAAEPSDSGPQIFVGLEVDVDFDDLEEDTDTGMRLPAARERLDTWEQLGAELAAAVSNRASEYERSEETAITTVLPMKQAPALAPAPDHDVPPPASGPTAVMLPQPPAPPPVKRSAPPPPPAPVYMAPPPQAPPPQAPPPPAPVARRSSPDPSLQLSSPAGYVAPPSHPAPASYRAPASYSAAPSSPGYVTPASASAAVAPVASRRAMGAEAPAPAKPNSTGWFSAQPLVDDDETVSDQGNERAPGLDEYYEKHDVLRASDLVDGNEAAQERALKWSSMPPPPVARSVRPSAPGQRRGGTAGRVVALSLAAAAVGFLSVGAVRTDLASRAAAATQTSIEAPAIVRKVLPVVRVDIPQATADPAAATKAGDAQAGAGANEAADDSGDATAADSAKSTAKSGAGETDERSPRGKSSAGAVAKTSKKRDDASKKKVDSAAERKAADSKKDEPKTNPTMGTLVARANKCTLKIDGAPAGGGIVRRTVKPGVHLVSCKGKDGKLKAQALKVEAGKIAVAAF
jgi:hypothetical protein